jgi:lysozyme family protein
MASVVSAINYTMRQEDRSMSGIVKDDPRDSGGRTRYGIAERFHPELKARGFFDWMTDDEALKVAQSYYVTEYCVPLHLCSIADQQVANALVSFAVNEGVKTSIKVAQSALGLDCDGILGPATLSAINAKGFMFLKLLEAKQIAHYESIVAANPKDRAFLNGWINRVKEDCAA